MKSVYAVIHKLRWLKNDGKRSHKQSRQPGNPAPGSNLHTYIVCGSWDFTTHKLDVTPERMQYCQPSDIRDEVYQRSRSIMTFPVVVTSYRGFISSFCLEITRFVSLLLLLPFLLCTVSFRQLIGYSSHEEYLMVMLVSGNTWNLFLSVEFVFLLNILARRSCILPLGPILAKFGT